MGIGMGKGKPEMRTHVGPSCSIIPAAAGARRRRGLLHRSRGRRGARRNGAVGADADGRRDGARRHVGRRAWFAGAGRATLRASRGIHFRGFSAFSACPVSRGGFSWRYSSVPCIFDAQPGQNPVRGILRRSLDAACGENYSDYSGGGKWSGSPAAGRGSLVVAVGAGAGAAGFRVRTGRGTRAPRDTMLQRLDCLRSVGWSGWSGVRRFAGFVDGTGSRRVSTEAPAAT